MFASLVLGLVPVALPQGGQADRPVGLSVVVVDVGQGDGVVVRAPNGVVHVVDAGPEGQGAAAMLPAIQALQPSGYGFTVLSHFHTDHVGGLDDVLALPFQVALDRGDVNRPSNTSVNGYVAAAGARRQTIAVGAVYQLGGGATMRCLSANGNVAGGAFVNPANSAQEENSRSIALRIDYGDFSLWLGGDLTGGGNSTADVEGPASLACGDVDVYKLNHHGSNTSTSQALVLQLAPELAIASCGTNNPYGHPTPTVVNRLNHAAAARALLATTTGTGTIGFGVTGTVRIDTDGFRYRATAANGDFLDFYCDEVAPAPLAAGSVRISEVLRDPSAVPDTNGEYVEVQNVGSKPVALAGLSLSDNAGTITLASNYMLVPGRPMVFQVDGAPTRNGGQPLGVALPYQAIALSNSSDVVTLTSGATVVDSLSYTSGWPGQAGAAAERRDLFVPNASTNYAAATTPFGGALGGDLGSPGSTNAADITVHPVQVGVDVRPGSVTLHATALDHGNHFSVLGLAAGSATGFPFGGAWIPLDPDPLFQQTLGIAGLFALQPAAGYRSVELPMPQPNPSAGALVYVAHIVLDIGLNVPGVSSAVPFVLP